MNNALKRAILLLTTAATLTITVIVYQYPTRVDKTVSPTNRGEEYRTDMLGLTIKNYYHTSVLHPSVTLSTNRTAIQMSVTIPNTTAVTPSVTSSDGVLQKEIPKQGFVLAIQYNDQITGGTMNLLSLQCWAKSVTPPNGDHSVGVVEPFIQQGSRFGATLAGKRRSPKENVVLLRDLFDYLRWTAYAVDKGYAELIGWEKFLESSPKQIIMVYNTCTNCNVSDCLLEHNLSSSKQMFLITHNFEIVRTVCFRIGPVHMYSANEFKDLVYGTFASTSVTVIFDTWGGIIDERNTLKRLILSDLPKCVRSQNDGLMAPSSKVVSDSKEYMNQYIHKSANSDTVSDVYIAVMFRMEYYAILLKHKGTSKNSQYNSLLRCINSIARKVNQLKKTHQTESVFLAMDYGKFGSFSLRRLLQEESDKISLTKDDIDAASQKLYSKLFGNSSSLKDWEESFDRVARVKSPGYVAMMQKTLASRATCLVLIGGGSFQKTAQEMFKTFNNGSNCVYDLCGKAY